MDVPWRVQQQLEFLSGPTSIVYHRIDKYTSIAEGVRRVRRVLGGGPSQENMRLIYACAHNDIETVRRLLETVPSDVLDLRSGVNRSALHEAVLHRDGQQLARLLFQHGANPKQRDSLGRTPIHYAASSGHLDILKSLVYFSECSVTDLRDNEGRTPMMYACGEGHLAVCQWIVHYQPDEWETEDGHGRSCLIYAARAGHVDIVRWLLPMTVSVPTNLGWYPLHFACAAGHLDVVKVLLERSKYEAYTVTNSGHSALFMAMHASINRKEMVNYLLDSCPNIQLSSQDINDLHCDVSLIYLLAQRCLRLDNLADIIEKMNYPLPLIIILLLGEHAYLPEELLSMPCHQSFIRYHLQNPLKLKQIVRRFIRESIDVPKSIDLLEINQTLKKYIRFEIVD